MKAKSIFNISKTDENVFILNANHAYNYIDLLLMDDPDELVHFLTDQIDRVYTVPLSVIWTYVESLEEAQPIINKVLAKQPVNVNFLTNPNLEQQLIVLNLDKNNIVNIYNTDQQSELFFLENNILNFYYIKRPHLESMKLFIEFIHNNLDLLKHPIKNHWIQSGLKNIAFSDQANVEIIMSAYALANDAFKGLLARHKNYKPIDNILIKLKNYN